MADIVLSTGFFSEVQREYNGEYIMKVQKTVEDEGTTKYLLENGVWVMDVGSGRYRTEWNAEEFWGRIDRATADSSAEKDANLLGFILLHVDRAKGYRLFTTERKSDNDSI